MDESLEIIRRRAVKHGVEMEVLRASDCCRPVDLEGEPFRFLCGAVENVFPGCPYSPYVMTGATDARFYQEICDHVFRFAPVIYGPEQMKGMHGLNENIGTACLPGPSTFTGISLRTFHKALFRAKKPAAVFMAAGFLNGFGVYCQGA